MAEVIRPNNSVLGVLYMLMSVKTCSRLMQHTGNVDLYLKPISVTLTGQMERIKRCFFHSGKSVQCNV